MNPPRKLSSEIHSPSPAPSSIHVNPDELPSPTPSTSPKESILSSPVQKNRLQLVDEKKAFTSDLEDFLKEEFNISNVGMDYNVVAVFGSQSTGKSTLLNRLFGTHFDVMNEKQRSQTTKGIWLAKSSTPEKNILVLDLEGTDGRERGEDQDFERKSSLFALAIAEVVIINMWENMVGLYHGANMALLKTVLEAHLQLFQKEGSPKTHLFFVIRDHSSGTPLSSLADTLTTDLTNLWASLKPPYSIETYFTLTFTSLPHKRLLPEAFENDVLQLQHRFVNQNDPNYVFHAMHHKQLPLDGFPRYSSKLWEQIQSHEDLDVPTQQELVAQFRCDALMEQAEKSFMDHLRSLSSDQEVEGSVLDEYLTSALTMYDHQAQRYSPTVYKKTRDTLIQRMRDQHGLRIFENGMRKLLQKVLIQFPETLDKQLRIKNTKYFEAMSTTRKKLLDLFKTKLQSKLLLF
ncbi:Dynamin-like GTPase that mediates homotypic ER fusion [Coelomomyces lativittatus]|nr:Dynamin-like GTPase that mediates homotypic ER fusion [Coelomomyces lativittatus]KAJ1511032.1 Dynamin-like GTPase that mediates homotypic ER fusion [Coelomomyces lativittatus]